MKFGLHVSIAGGVANAVQRAADAGCDCFQIFVANPRSWNGKRVAKEDAEKFRTQRAKLKIGPVIVHLSYLPNLASPDKKVWQRSLKHFLMQYEDARLIEADYFVLHPGSAKDSPEQSACKRLACALDKAYKKICDGPQLLLENMAGGGSSLGAPPEQLAEVVRQMKSVRRVGVCLDTAHAHASGLDMSKKGTTLQIKQRLRKSFGYHPIKLLHANDCMTMLGSKHDRHQHVGKGEIGASGFKDVFHTPGLRKLPVIMETPVNEEGNDTDNLSVARKLSKALNR